MWPWKKKQVEARPPVELFIGRMDPAEVVACERIVDILRLLQRNVNRVTNSSLDVELPALEATMDDWGTMLNRAFRAIEEAFNKSTTRGYSHQLLPQVGITYSDPTWYQIFLTAIGILQETFVHVYGELQ